MTELKFKVGDEVADNNGTIGVIEQFNPSEKFPYRIREANGALAGYREYSDILDNRTNEWVVYVCDPDAPMYQAEAARYPVSAVEAIRYLPNETRLYSHAVIDDELDAHGTQARQAVEQ